MRTISIALVFLLTLMPGDLFAAEPVHEDDIEFSQMSVLNPSKEFQVFLDLARSGDARAQFILGDVYAKGRSGLEQNDEKARKWFTRAARQDYHPALVRLAALEKHADDPLAAYKWYNLALDRFDSKSKTYAFVKEAQRELVREAGLTSKQQSEAKRLAGLWAQGKPDDRKPEKPQPEVAAVKEKPKKKVPGDKKPQEHVETAAPKARHKLNQ